MKKIFANFMILILLASWTAGGLLITGPAAAQDSGRSKTFVGVGTAPVYNNNVSAARAKAIDDGLVMVVALMTLELLQLESFVEYFPKLSELLFDQKGAFIKDYKVLSEVSRNKSYHVVVQAAVSESKISSYLAEAGILRTAITLPSVLVLMAEQKSADSDTQFWWGTEGAYVESFAGANMVERLKEAGFPTIDPRQARSGQAINWADFNQPDLSGEKAAKLGSLLKADVVVIGQSVAKPSTNIMGSAMRSFNGTVTARVIRSNTAELILNLTRTTTVVNEDEAAGRLEALEEVGSLAGQALAEELTITWQKQAGRPSEVTMIIRGTGHLASYVKFRKAMNTISGVEGIRVKGIKPNEAALLVEYKGKAKDLAAALMQQNFNSFGINIFEVTPDTIKVELISD